MQNEWQNYENHPCAMKWWIQAMGVKTTGGGIAVIPPWTHCSVLEPLEVGQPESMCLVVWSDNKYPAPSWA